MFTGRQYDPESGLYYYRARMYSPLLGRFLQTDPVGYADGMNWYAYCGNNPLGFVDPYGLFPGPGSPEEAIAQAEAMAQAYDVAMRWLYTGDMNATNEVYNAATEKAAAVIVQWGVANANAHKQVITAVIHTGVTTAALISSYFPWLPKTELEIGRGFGPKTLLSDKTTILSRSANLSGSKTLRRLARQTKNAPFATAAKIGLASAALVEAGIGVYSGYQAYQSDGIRTFSDGSQYDPLGNSSTRNTTYPPK